jgi:CRISPR/Cas system CMR-associated protein Cmr1 (group 7 of RAMP superfamily)
MKEEQDEHLPQLPSFPTGSLGNRFSQNSIKEAVTGRKEVEGVQANEFADENSMQMMQRPHVREEAERTDYSRMEKPIERTAEGPIRTKEAEPIFIRIDKFEEGSQTFEEVKKKISEIEKMLNDIKKVKEEEEKELEFWEDEITKIKEKIDKIDKNLFSQSG